MVSSFPIDLAACCADGESALMVQRSRWDAVDHFGSRCLSEQSVAHGAAGERPDPIGYAESWAPMSTARGSLDSLPACQGLRNPAGVCRYAPGRWVWWNA